MGSQPTEKRRGRGRPRLEDSFLVSVAVDYCTALANGTPPVAFVAAQRRHEGERGLTLARNWIHAARREGFLTKTPSGTAGGRLSAKSVRILRGTTRK